MLTVKVLVDERFFLFLSPFVWPIAGLALATFAVAVWKAYQIFSRIGSDVRRLRSGLGVLLFFSGASLAVSGCGFLFHLQRFLRSSVEDAPASLFMNFAGWMMKISSMMTIGLLTSILTALVWFVLSNLVTRSELREMKTLLEAEA